MAVAPPTVPVECPVCFITVDVPVTWRTSAFHRREVRVDVETDTGPLLEHIKEHLAVAEAPI